MGCWIKMPLGAEVGLGPGDIVLDEDPAPLTQSGTTVSPLFGPHLLWRNGRPSQQLLSSCKIRSSSATAESTISAVKAKFHYAIWFEAGSKLVADRFEAGRNL